jgi:hypothetical protein
MHYDPSADPKVIAKARQQEQDGTKKAQQAMILTGFMPIEEVFEKMFGAKLEIDEEDTNV